ncbi:DUF3240 family protein [Comamonas sp. B-9]|uniref:DUF3240 family protein n=1 Tax=Comamonas sp. B-9 TaxID=1055192 RepID=UPI0009FD15D2|nr:DUF3240 family protein [Comamonas sp. B-9]
MLNVVLTVLVTSHSEEATIDVLMDQELERGFSTSPAYLHGSDVDSLTPEELVLGKQEAIRFDVVLPYEKLQPVLSALRAHLARSGARFWVTPAQEQGEFL